MRNPFLRKFIDAVQQDPELQKRCQRASSLAELVDIAHGLGIPISRLDLQLWAHHEGLDAPWWPWGALSARERLAFFRGTA